MAKKRNITAQEALAKAQNLCAAQEKCVSDIRKKLYDWKLPLKDHEGVIKKLLEEQFIDENRYALFFAKDKFRYNKWGKIKIEFALKQKNISRELITNSLDEIPDSEYEDMLKKELLKKLKTIKDTDEYTIKSKLLRFAASRGFENGKVFDMVSSIIDKPEN